MQNDQNTPPQSQRGEPRKLESSNFTNNTAPNTLKNKFKDILNSDTKISYLDFLIGYFRISGFVHLYDLIKDKLDDLKEIRILVGINVDHLVAELAQENIDKDSSDSKRFLKQFKSEQARELNINSAYSFDADESIFKLIEALKENKIQIRIIKKMQVHAKFYVFSAVPKQSNTNNSYNYNGSVIIGSSNLSNNGLVKNYEFNAELRGSDDIENALYEFNQLWQESVPIDGESIENIKEETYLKSISPRDLYYKLLLQYFTEDRIKIDQSIESLFPMGYKALQYQIYAITDGLNKLRQYNGFFLSDVVGLGKTLIATIIAQKLEISGELRGKILIACPPALKDNWENHITKVGINRQIKIETHDMLDKIKDAAEYGLIIVDESHRFKSKKSQRYKALHNICKEDSKYTKKVILLSATPQNNSPKDLQNQIYLFKDPRSSTIGRISNLSEFFDRIIKEYKEIKKILKPFSSKGPESQKDKERYTQSQKRLKTISDEVRDEILKYIMIRRTRSDIESLYSDDLKAQNINFPKTPAPMPLNYELSLEAINLSLETLNILELKDNKIGKYGYFRYLVYPNLTEQGKNKFLEKMGTTNKDKFYESTANRLTGLMKTLLFKRFESSIYSFLQTLGEQIKSTKSLMDQLKSDKVHIPKNFTNLDAYYDALEDLDEDFFERNEGDFITLTIDDFKPDYLSNLETDLQTITILKEKWQRIQDEQEDPKLNKLIEQIRANLKIKIKNNPNEKSKVVIFTEAKSTATYISAHLKEEFKDNLLQVDSSNRKALEETIKANFDASLPKEKQQNKINILLSTDTLAEGVNMHRANVLINYDTPWNATKLMQRAGRINRIGTIHEEIFIYNFQPSNMGEEILKFREQVLQKLQSFHYTLGEDSAIYLADEQLNKGGVYQSTKYLEEAQDPENEYLADILKLFKEGKEEYERIKALPDKIRSFTLGDDVSYFYFKQQVEEIHKTHTNKYIGDYFYRRAEGEVERIEFLQMAKYLKAHLDSRELKLNRASHYKDFDAVLQFHNHSLEEGRIKKARQNLSKIANEAKFKIQRGNLLQASASDGIKAAIINAIDRGILNDSDLKKFNDDKLDLEALYQKIEGKTNQDTNIKLHYTNPTLQISYTTKRK